MSRPPQELVGRWPRRDGLARREVYRPEPDRTGPCLPWGRCLPLVHANDMIHRQPTGGGVPCDRISTTHPAFEVMSKRRRGYPERDPRQAGQPGRPRQQGTPGAARPQRPLPVRQRALVQEVLPQHGLVSTEWSGTTTSGSSSGLSRHEAFRTPIAPTPDEGHGRPDARRLGGDLVREP